MLHALDALGFGAPEGMKDSSHKWVGQPVKWVRVTFEMGGVTFEMVNSCP